jgi:hypothetical protein
VSDTLPFPLTGVENAAIRAAEEMARLEALVANLEEERDRWKSKADTLALQNKRYRDQLAANAPWESVAMQLDRIAQFLTAQSMDLTNLRTDVDNILANHPV